MKTSSMKWAKPWIVVITLMMVGSLVLAACSNNDGNNAGETPDKEAESSSGGTTENDAAENETDAKETTAGENSDTPAKPERLEFSFYVNYDWYSTKSYGNDPGSQYIIENRNVHVEEISANGNAKQKLGTMIASKDLPDVIQMDWGTDFNQMVDNGLIVPVEDYMHVMPNFSKFAAPEMLDILRHDDGKLYGIPNWFGNKELSKGPDTVNRGWIVKEDVYKELGSPPLKTYQDLYEYLKKVKANYPDMIPLDTANTSDGSVQVQNFFYVGADEGRAIEFGKPNGMFMLPDPETQTMTNIFDDTAHYTSYQWLNRLFREKLLTQDTFTQKLEQFKEKLNTGKIAVAGVYEAGVHADAANQLLPEGEGYIYIPYPVAEGVDYGKLQAIPASDAGWNLNAVTTSAEDPERIFKFIDWLMGYEWARVWNYGPPGTLWHEVDEETQSIVPVENFKQLYEENKDELQYGHINYVGNGVTKGNVSYYVNQKLANAKTFVQKAQEEWGKTGLYPFDQFRHVHVYDPNSEENRIRTEIKNTMAEYVAKMTFAASDEEFDRIYQEAEQAIMDAGYDKLLDFNTQVWRDNLAKSD